MYGLPFLLGLGTSSCLSPTLIIEYTVCANLPRLPGDLPPRLPGDGERDGVLDLGLFTVPPLLRSLFF